MSGADAAAEAGRTEVAVVAFRRVFAPRTAPTVPVPDLPPHPLGPAGRGLGRRGFEPGDGGDASQEAARDDRGGLAEEREAEAGEGGRSGGWRRRSCRVASKVATHGDLWFWLLLPRSLAECRGVPMAAQLHKELVPRRAEEKQHHHHGQSKRSSTWMHKGGAAA